MKLNPRLPKGKAKIILGSLFAAALIAIFLFVFLKNSQITPQSSIELIFQNNKFIFSPNLTAGDQKYAENLINYFGLPQNSFKGFQFSLDSTSSAKLAFSAPLKSNINLSDNQIRFNGLTSQPLVNSQYKPKNFKIPQNILLNSFGSNLHPFFLSRQNVPPELNNWLIANVQKDSPEYFLIFNNSDTVLLWQNSQIDFSQLKNINAKDTDYKEENDEDITYHLYKLPKNKNGEETTLAFFKINDFAVVATSPSAAKEITKAIKSKDSGSTFMDDTTEVSFYLDFKNPQKKLDSSFKTIFFNDSGQSVPKEKIFETLEKVSEFKLTLKANSFSGLINW